MHKISQAKIDDADRINVLVNSAYRGDVSRQGWTTEADLLDGTRITSDIIADIITSKNSQLLIYEIEGRLLGCVELRKEEERLYLGMLTVDPASQGKGIGKVLLQEAERVAKEQKCRSIFMSVISKRLELIDWYKKYGYKDTGERKPFHMPDERWGVPKMELEFMYLQKNLS